MSRWSTMQARVEDYLTTRRQLGYALVIEGEQLQRFARFADAQQHRSAITVELAVAWACASNRSGPIGRARRLEVVRPLAKFCAAFEPETQVPPARLLGPAHRRLTPHIYTEEELAQMLTAAGALTPAQGLRPASMQCLLGLLAATGLRVSEALHLQRVDVDLKQGLLCVRQTKFRKSRYVPLHPTARDALAEYAHLRDQRLPLHRREPAFFLLDDGRAFRYEQARYAFQRVRTRLGWDNMPGHRPRLYDLRHTFTCNRLLGWYQEGVDVDSAMPLLATYLGHTKVTDTYWYLTAIPALMAIVSERFECLANPRSKQVAP
jgi:integrase